MTARTAAVRRVCRQVLLSTAALRERGALVEHVLCVVDREEGGSQNLAAEGLSTTALFTGAELRRSGAS
ncbi:hypothetical protein [Pseudonocardia endophytica]|uniref:hypothetical protein n=1 Tax=Pseudonocardia endophytica TaxID=401976 RepID=UPI00104F60B4|nr:hypothetical protein [Pseudonocardia endophytica]